MITTNSVFSTPSMAMFFIVLATVSCDTLSEDQISPNKQFTFGQTHFYIVHGSSLFIDGSSFIKESFVDATLVISTRPSKGDLTRLDNILLRYQPGEEFLTGTDELVLSVWIDGKDRHTETVKITMKSSVDELPCGLYAIDDNVIAVTGLVVNIPVLENDVLCGAGNSALEVSIHSAPAHGEASVAGNAITYTPGSTFAGSDEFIYKLTAGEDSISYAAVKIGQCMLTAEADTINLANGGTSVKILGNDELCGIRKNGLEVSISSGPQFGTASLVGDSVIVYSAGPEFKGRDQLTYQLSTGADGESVHATVQIVEDWIIELLEAPQGTELFFVDEMTGFVGGAGGGMFKTTNGGKTWIAQTLPTVGSISGIQFLNKQLGYATYILCGESDAESNCLNWYGGLLQTLDGGESWNQVTSFSESTFSFFFTSPTTGYVSILDQRDTPQQRVMLLKTENGFGHYEDVFSKATPGNPGSYAYEVVFASSNIGYAWGSAESYFTKDAGQSWQEVTMPGAFISSIAVTPNFAFSSLSSSASFGAPDPSSIVRSTHGGNWQTVMNFPYNSWRLGFSPSGNLGITVGLSDPNVTVAPDTWSITITRTVDQGETWMMDTGEKPVAFPWAISVPSDRLAYILCDRKLIRYSYP